MRLCSIQAWFTHQSSTGRGKRTYLQHLCQHLVSLRPVLPCTDACPFGSLCWSGWRGTVTSLWRSVQWPTPRLKARLSQWPETAGEWLQPQELDSEWNKTKTRWNLRHKLEASREFNVFVRPGCVDGSFGWVDVSVYADVWTGQAVVHWESSYSQGWGRAPKSNGEIFGLAIEKHCVCGGTKSNEETNGIRVFSKILSSLSWRTNLLLSRTVLHSMSESQAVGPRQDTLECCLCQSVCMTYHSYHSTTVRSQNLSYVLASW